MMQAIVHENYGSFDLLRPREIDKPAIAADGVLVRVHAAALHVGDCFSVRGAPFAMRFATGLLRPKRGIPGFDVAGRVEAVGEKVTRFRPGDEVFGACEGACAEYVATRADHLAPKPAGIALASAAALATSGLAALHGLRDAGKLQPGQRVLVNGASGGVGTFAIQIAKALGAEVTGVCGPRNVELVRSLGADHVIDYTREDFTQGATKYDLVLDNVENRSLAECRRALTPRGTLVLNSGTGATGLRMLARLLAPLVISPFVRHDLRRYLSMPNHADLLVLRDLVDAGKLEPVIDRTYALHDVPSALAYIEAGHARGKVLVTP